MGLVDWVPGPGLAASQMTSAVFVFGGGFEIGHSFDRFGGSPGPGLYKPYVAMASQWRSPVIFCSNVYNIKSIGMLRMDYTFSLQGALNEDSKGLSSAKE